MLQHKKCVIVAGPTGCGKTTMFRVLSNAINFMQVFAFSFIYALLLILYVGILRGSCSSQGLPMC